MRESRRAAEAADLIWRHWQAGTVMAALPDELRPESRAEGYAVQAGLERFSDKPLFGWKIASTCVPAPRPRSEDHTSELQSLMRISYAVFFLTKKTYQHQ